jgi:hypothetical protein
MSAGAGYILYQNFLQTRKKYPQLPAYPQTENTGPKNEG